MGTAALQVSNNYSINKVSHKVKGGRAAEALWLFAELRSNLLQDGGTFEAKSGWGLRLAEGACSAKLRSSPYWLLLRKSLAASLPRQVLAFGAC